MGILPRLSVRILVSSLSTQTTSLPDSAKHAPATSPTYPVPTTAIRISLPRVRPSPRVTKQQRLSYRRMRILVDYRPALRARTGVGEYIRRLVQAYTGTQRDEVTLLTSSWKDRPAA